MRLVFDIEANGLYDDATTIWCVVAKDITTNIIYKFHIDNTFAGIYETFSQAEEVIGHNIIDYDLPLLQKLFGIYLCCKVTDTLVISRVLNPDRLSPLGIKGGHSLEAWGKRLGKYKQSHDDWTKFSDKMLERCTSDVEITHLLYNTLQQEAQGHDWSSALELEHRVAYIISKQARDGVYFDIAKAKELHLKLTDKVKEIDDYLLQFLPKSYKQIGVTVTKPFKIDGTHSRMVTDYYEDPSIVGGPFTRIEWEEFNLNSESKIKEYLLNHGWEPTEWNYTKNKDTGEYTRSSPKLTEDSFGTINGDIPAKVKERLLVAHRSSTLMSSKNCEKGWLASVRPDGTISASANPCGTNTCRMTHSTVVNVPKAKAYIPYGKEMRELFIPRPGRVLVGHDAEQLELRMLAHYINDEQYTKELLSGDIHVYNQTLAGLDTRDDAKTFIYAFIYGAGDEKLGAIVGGRKREGAEIRKRFLESNPRLGSLIEKVKREARKGYLVGLDGRKIWMRKDESGRVMTHKALNTLLQSAGAIVMKRSMVILADDISYNNLDCIKVIDMHDESQYDVNKKHVDKHMELAKQSIVKAGIFYNLNIPLSASVNKGNNWAETH